MVRTAVPINRGGRLRGVMDGSLSPLSDESSEKKKRKEAYYNTGVVPHLPYVSTHDGELSDKLNRIQHEAYVSQSGAGGPCRSSRYSYLVEVRADGMVDDRLGDPWQEEKRNLLYWERCLFT